MIRGLYTAASGMIMEMVRNDTISNNLANVNTVGFKKDVAVFNNFNKLFIQRLNNPPAIKGEKFSIYHPIRIGNVGTGVKVDAICVDHSNGHLQQTENPLDLALQGDGFFVVETPSGLRYTRDGAFSLNNRGELVTRDGFRVLGENGFIVINGTEVNIGEDGNVQVDGKFIDRIQIVDFEDRRVLRKVGRTLFMAPLNAPVVSGSAKVLSRNLEMPNVEIATEMVNMITAMRSYEINQKAIHTEDEMLSKVINEVGKPV